MNKKDILIAAAVALVFQLVFSLSTSPLYVLYGGDAPFFEIIGLGITQGKVPYVDLFDHKGPVVFFINALGFSLGIGKYGVFVLQLIAMTVSVLFFRKLAGLFTSSSKKAWAAVLLSLVPLVDFAVDGNHCEEWMLPFSAASLYLALKYVLSGEKCHKLWWSVFYGISCAVMFYIRPTDGVMWIGGLFLGLMIYWFVRGMRNQILPNIGAFIGGFALVSAPIFIYFGAHGAIPDFIYGMIIHNVKYAGDAMFTWGGIGMIIVPLVITAASMWLLRKEGKTDLWYILAGLLVLTLILIGKRDYYHYLMPFVPQIAVCFALCLEHRWKTYLWIVVSLFAVFSYRGCTYIVKGVQKRADYKTLYEQTDSLFDLVPESERNNVWNYNLTVYFDNSRPHIASLLGAYLHRGVTPGNRVFAYFQLDYLEPGDRIIDKEPKWVLMQPDDYFHKDFDYIFENYDLVAATPSEPVCEVRLYRRKVAAE